jgi:hypothetical protein
VEYVGAGVSVTQLVPFDAFFYLDSRLMHHGIMSSSSSTLKKDYYLVATSLVSCKVWVSSMGRLSV